MTDQPHNLGAEKRGYELGDQYHRIQSPTYIPTDWHKAFTALAVAVTDANVHLESNNMFRCWAALIHCLEIIDMACGTPIIKKDDGKESHHEIQS